MKGSYFTEKGAARPGRHENRDLASAWPSQSQWPGFVLPEQVALLLFPWRYFLLRDPVMVPSPAAQPGLSSLKEPMSHVQCGPLLLTHVKRVCAMQVWLVVEGLCRAGVTRAGSSFRVSRRKRVAPMCFVLSLDS